MPTNNTFKIDVNQLGSLGLSSPRDFGYVIVHPQNEITVSKYFGWLLKLELVPLSSSHSVSLSLPD